MGIAAGVGAAAAAVSAGASVAGAVKSGKGGGGGGASIPRQVMTPSFNTYLDGGTSDFTLKPTDRIEALLANMRGVLSGASGELKQVQGQVTPGFGRLTQTINDKYDLLAEQLHNQARSATSDLRANLEKRRVLGSSFAADAATRSEAEFEKIQQSLEASRRQDLAGAFIAELGQTIDLIGKRATFDTQAISEELQQLNFESSAAVSISSGVTSAMTQNSLLQQKLAAEAGLANAQGTGNFLGKLIFGKNFGTGANAESLLSVLSRSLGGGGDGGAALSAANASGGGTFGGVDNGAAFR